MASDLGARLGEPAPDLTLPSAPGEPARLSDYRGRSGVVLFFYPKDNSPACTAEVCSFRDTYDVFREAGAEVIGVSGDSAESHAKFGGRHGVPFRLVSDPKGEIRARFGVPKTFGLLPGRVTYLIDREGIVRLIFSSQFQPARHVEEALRVLNELRGRPAAPED